MSYEYRPAKREGLPLLIGLAGGTGAGKTFSAMRLASGLAGGERFAVLDTENGRASHYADQFTFDVAELRPPYRPERYAEAIIAADKGDYPVIVVDSMSHEWAGDGGLLDWHEEEWQKSGGRDANKLAAWVKPKMAHRKFVTNLLQTKAHLILCFRAAERVEMVKGQGGKMEVAPKRTRTGLDGWVLITEKELPFELTLSLLMTEDAPGVPKPVKLPEQLRLLLPLDQAITEEAGDALAGWAKGVDANDEAIGTLTRDLLDLADQLGNRDDVTAAIQKHRRRYTTDQHVDWLGRQLEHAEGAVETQEDAEIPWSEPTEATA